MKKFIIFLVAIVASVCVGMTIFYFVRNNEVIKISTNEIFCNTGDVIPVDSLGIKIKNANISKKTKFDYNAGGEEVESFISYDSDKKAYVVNDTKGGDVQLVISSTNKKYSDFTIMVHIGDGSEENPYFLFNESDLKKMGGTYSMNKSFALMSDIALSQEFSPIGYFDDPNDCVAFSGHFNGNGHTISQMALSGKYVYAGFFGLVAQGAVVENLKFDSASISGNYFSAGVLAGVFNGNAEKIIVENSTIQNIANNGTTGSIAGTILNDLIMCYAENVDILIGEDGRVVTGAEAGGLVGASNQGTIRACYANDVEIKTNNATGKFGGLVGKMFISAPYGIVQQSYANVVSNDANFAAFIGEIDKTSDFNKSEAKVLRHLVGNIAIVPNKSTSQIVDTDLVKTFDNTYFENKLSKGSSIFFHKENALYLIRGFGSVQDVINTNEYVYYAQDTKHITTWNMHNIWQVEEDRLPTLRMGKDKPSLPATAYINRDLTEKSADSEEGFKNIFSSSVVGQKIRLATNIELTNWSPIEVKNSIIDGNNKTITVKLNSSIGMFAGLFSSVENSSISNLVINVVGNVAHAEFFGGLATRIVSSSKTEASVINGVVIKYNNANFSNASIDNFGGIAGQTSANTIIKNSRAVGLNLTENSDIKNAGMIVGVNRGKIYRCNLEGQICASGNVGTVAGINYGTIDTVETGGGDVARIVLSGTNTAKVGGVVGTNSGVITNIKIRTKIDVKKYGGNSFIGGVVGYNEGEISNVNILGDGISVASQTEKIFIGGIAGRNSNKATISSVHNKLKTVGTYNSGKYQYVAGVVADNNGKISQVISQSDLFGNYVSGVVSIMRAGNVDQIVVGKLTKNPSSKKISTSKIKIEGDKYLAGICVEFKGGTISNVQTASEIKGKSNATRSSLVVLIFPNGAKVNNSTIDSSLVGYGTKYRETWTDFANYSNKAEFGYSAGATGDSRFNIYTNNSHHGCMQSVVINGANSGVSSAIASKCEAFWWAGVLTVDYENNSESSFVKVASNFSYASQFQGSFTFSVATYNVLWSEKSYDVTRTLTFKIGSIWKSENGIRLSFVDAMV